MTWFRSVAKSPGNYTYLFTPKSVIQSLAASFTDAAVLDSLIIPSLNATSVLKGNDTLPPGINASEISIGGESCSFVVHVAFFEADQGAFVDNGVAHSFFSTPLSQGRRSLHPTKKHIHATFNCTGADGKGWISLEHVLIRLNTSYTPNGTFPVLSAQSIPDTVTGKPTYIGYDAVVCLQLFEPWVVKVWNSTTGLLTVGITDKAAGIDSTEKEARLIGEKIGGVSRELNSTLLWNV